MAMIEEILKNLHWSENEIKVYLATLQIGPQAASIIGRKAGLNRSTAYVTLMKLVKDGVISQSKKGTIKFFSVDSPETLLTYLDQQKQTLETSQQKLEALLPDLAKMKNPNFSMPKITFYEGIEGTKQCYEEILKGAEHSQRIDSYLFVSEPYLPELIDYWPRYIKKRLSKNIFTRILAADTEGGRHLKARDPKEMRETRLVSPNLFQMSYNEINIYGNFFHYLSFGSKQAFSCIIEDANLAETQRGIFEVCWKLAATGGPLTSHTAPRARRRKSS